MPLPTRHLAPLPRRPRVRHLALAPVVAALLGLAACSGGSDDASDAGPAATTTPATATTVAAPGSGPSASTPGAAADRAAVAALVDVLARRLEVGTEVARTKWNTKAPIEDLAREAQALDAIATAALAAGVDPEAARQLLRAQIDAGKIAQRSLHEQWTAEGRAPFATVADLVTDLRPQLDEITTLLIARLRELGGLPRLDAAAATAAEQTLTTRLAGVPRAAEAARTALAPLRAG